MSLISPIDPPLTPAQKAAKDVREDVQHVWSTMVQRQIDIYKRVWLSGDYTPQQVLNELGTDAAQLFQLGAANVGTILGIDPTALTEGQWKPPSSVQFNGDGTVTVLETPSV